MLSAEASNSTHHKSDSITESQFSSVMPYTEDTGQTSDSVFAETSTDPHDTQHIAQIPSPNNTSMHPILLYQHLYNLLFPGEALEVQREYHLYIMGML